MDALKVALADLRDATKPIDAADRNLILRMIENAWKDADHAREERDRLKGLVEEAIGLRVALYQNGCECEVEHVCNARANDPYAKRWTAILNQGAQS